MINIIEQYGIYVYALVILFGGIWGIQFIPFKWKTKYKFLLFSSIIAVIFILIEVANKTFAYEQGVRYLLTYTGVTSCYQIFMESVFKKMGLIKKDDDDVNT